MNIFNFHNQIITDYKTYIESFINIRDEEIRKKVEQEILDKKLFPEPLLQFNPSFEKKESDRKRLSGRKLKHKKYLLYESHF